MLAVVSFMFTFGVCGLFFMHTYLLCRNQTTLGTAMLCATTLTIARVARRAAQILVVDAAGVAAADRGAEPAGCDGIQLLALAGAGVVQARSGNMSHRISPTPALATA